MTVNDDSDEARQDPFNQYQQWALSKMNRQTTRSMEYGQLIAGALGLVGESGEFADAVKKILFHGHELTPIQRIAMADELGDVLWYIAVAADALQYSLAYIADKNMMKLNERYPDGFESSRSINRKESYPPIVETVGTTVAKQVEDNKRTESEAAAINDAILVDYQAKIESLYTTGEISTSRVPTTDELATALESVTNSTTVAR